MPLPEADLCGTARQRAATSPGPIYEVRPTMGPQVLSTYKTLPLVGFTKGGMTAKGRPIENLEGKGVPGPKVTGHSLPPSKHRALLTPESAVLCGSMNWTASRTGSR
jgi:hypothetical protein